MALVVLDASVVIGFLDPNDALHQACVDALAAHQRDELVIPLTVYAEILVAPFRVGSEAVSEVVSLDKESLVADAEIVLQSLMERRDEALELSPESSLWFGDLPPGTFSSRR